MKLKLFNSLSRKIEDFDPYNVADVKMYTCGPTVYDFAHIGNFRTYFLADILIRTLEFNGYKVTYIMNITDVGHLTGDNLGDADLGEDRMEKSAKKLNKSIYDIADYYTKVFKRDFKLLNFKLPKKFVKATEHILDQVQLIKILENKGFTYKTSDGIYFNTAKFPNYGKLSTLDKIKKGARVEFNLEKKNSRDFALWKFSQPKDNRQMEWSSPWGVGFPGWHIECSAMSMKYLGPSLDLHIGGEDLRSTHHPNEIAQSEAATNKQFVKYWLHGTFMLINGGKMSKSLGNVYRLDDIKRKGFEPLALRYLYLFAHYRSKLNFTWPSLEAAQKSLNKLRNYAQELSKNGNIREKSTNDKDEILFQFNRNINNDLDTPQALATTWKILRSNQSNYQKWYVLKQIDSVFGLNLFSVKQQYKIPAKINKLIVARNVARRKSQWGKADLIRKELNQRGYEIKDTPKGTKIFPTTK